MVARLIKRPWVSVSLGVTAVVAAGVTVRTLPVDLFPSDFQLYGVTIRLPEGSTLEQSRQVAIFVERYLQPQVDDGQVQYFTTTVGRAWTPDNILMFAPDLVQVVIFMHDDETQPQEPLERTRQLLNHAFAQPGAPVYRTLIVDAPQDGPPTGKPVQVRFQVDDYQIGEALADRTARFLGSIPGCTRSRPISTAGLRKRSWWSGRRSRLWTGSMRRTWARFFKRLTSGSG